MNTGLNTTLRGVMAGGLALVLLTGCGSKERAAEKSPAPERARAVRTTLIKRQALEGGVVASGLLVSREEAAVAPEVTGFRVAQVLADVGDTVRAGQVLVRLDDTLLRSQIDQQTALVSQANVAAEQAQAQAQRVDGLEGTGALASEQIEQRRFQAASSKAAAAAQAASLADLRTRATKMEVRAPVGGVIMERTVRPGELSGTGAGPMFRIVRDNLVELEAQVPESSLRAIQNGSAVTVSLPSGQSVQGRVRMVEPIVDQTTRLGRVRIALPVRSDLRPGGSATAQFTDLRADVLAAPETAVHYDANGASVFVVGSDNRVKSVPVTTGRRGGGSVELIEGPPEGSRILLGAASFVLEGDVVAPVDENAPAAAAPAAAAPARPAQPAAQPAGKAAPK